MKKMLGIVCALLMILGIAGTAGAALMTISDDIFFDDINNLYWYDNPGAFNSTSLTTQLNQINGLSVTVGSDLYNQWTMANQNDVSNLVNANWVGTTWLNVFDGLWELENLDDNRDWSLYARAQSSPTKFGSDVRLRVDDFGVDWQLSYGNYTGSVGAWVIQAEPASPVPEPATLFLLGSGLVGLAGFGRKKFFKSS